jgi:ABC-type uncharacterized transport system permease subunit
MSALLAQTGGLNMPSEVYSGLPYLVTLTVLLLTSRVRRPHETAAYSTVGDERSATRYGR